MEMSAVLLHMLNVGLETSVHVQQDTLVLQETLAALQVGVILY